jgi:hypothetical protein
MDIINNFNKSIIGSYSPISAKGGRRRRGKRLRTRKYKKSNKSRTRRNH